MSKQTTIITALNLLVVLGIIVLAWQWHIEQEARELARSRLVELRTKSADAAAGKNLLAQFQTDEAKLNAYFVNDQTLHDLIESLEGAATSTGVNLQLTQAGLAKNSNLGKLRLVFSATGSFSRVTNYLARLEALPYELVFNRVVLTLEQLGQKENLWRLETELELWTYDHEEI